MKLYLAGPMRNYPLYNFQAFEDAAVAIRGLGHEVVSPHEIDMEEGFVDWKIAYDDNGRQVFQHVELKGDFSFPRAIRRDLKALLACDAMAVLRGWEESEGAMIEDAVRGWCAMPRYLYRDIFGVPYLIHDEATPSAVHPA